MNERICSVEGCERRVKSLGLCNGHYQRHRKRISLDHPLREQQKGRTCSIDGCLLESYSKGRCKTHATLALRPGWSPDRDRRLDMSGPGNPNWKDNPGYAGAHDRIRRAKGAAKLHACGSCGAPAAEWAYVGGCADEMNQADRYDSPYCVHPDHYVAMCRPCHRHHDFEARVEREVQRRLKS